jgi:predicted transcriptional regulator
MDYINYTMPKTIAKKRSTDTVAYQKWVNLETGEEKEFAVVEREVEFDKNFYKIFLLDLLSITKNLGKGKIKVLYYILEKINPPDNLFLARVADIAHATNSSPNTVTSAINMLLEADFFRRKMQGVYMVSPRYIVKGNSNKRKGLMIIYKDLPEGFQSKSADFPSTENPTELT